MFSMQMRKKKSLLLLVVFAIYLSIAVFHPLSHGLAQHKNGHVDHECSICLWLSTTAIVLFPLIILNAIQHIVSFFSGCSSTPRIKDFFYNRPSRAPPIALSQIF